MHPDTKDGLKILKREPASERAKNLRLKWSKGPQLKSQARRWRVGWRGPTNVGKTHKLLSMLEDHIELRASDDEWIKEFFAYNPSRKIQLLDADEKTRRTYLRDGHRVFFLDFDNLGLQPLIDAEVCNEPLLKCISYIHIQTWAEAVAAKNLIIEELGKHEQEWGRMGCWIVVDNAAKAWSLCQSDYVKTLTGSDMNDIIADIKMQFPGKDSAARKIQSDKLGDLKDYTIISPSHNDEWLEPMLNTGYNFMMMAPNKDRKVEVKDGDKTYTMEKPTLGGHPNNPYAMDYIIRLYKSDDGATRFADVDKARHIGQVSSTIANPTWRAIREELEELEQEYLEEQRVRHAGKDYFDERPALGSSPVRESITTSCDETGVITITPPKPVIDDAFLKSAKKQELVDACSAYGERTDGKKDKLIGRLKRHHTDQTKVYDAEPEDQLDLDDIPDLE